MEQLTHEHNADRYVWIEDSSRESITQIGKCTQCGEDITRRAHVVGKPIFTEWVLMP